MQSVYIETTIPSYLTSRKSKQASLAADQEATREWWSGQRFHFRIFTSFYTIDECSRGNPDLAAKRLAKLKGVPELDLMDSLPDYCSYYGLHVPIICTPRTLIDLNND